MSKRANPAVIGSFIVGAVAIVVAGILIFGNSRFFSKRDVFVTYFEGSVKGLNVGAPVNFRGVRIGSVSDILVRIDRRDASIRIPVYIELEERRFTVIGDIAAEFENERTDAEFMDLLLERGLRAQLGLQSLLTGQLFVQLDFHPDSPIVLMGIDTDVPELPTVPAPLQQLSETIQELPLKELFDSAHHAIQGLDRIINSSDTNETIHSLRNTFASAEDMLAENSRLRYELSKALSEFAAASRSIRILAEGLQQQPETLIRGRSGFGTR